MKELLIDLHDYKENGTVFKRTAVRGIIKRDGRYLVIHSKYGDHKFPGGGMEQGETLEDTLLREVQEETGYLVKKDSIREGILVHEKRKGETADRMEMDSYYYFCDVEDKPGDRNLDEYEKDYDYRVSFMRLEDIIAKNEAVDNYENIPWISREIKVMKELLREEI